MQHPQFCRVPVDYAVQLVVKIALAVKVVYAFFSLTGCVISYFFIVKSSCFCYNYDTIFPMKKLSITCCYFSLFINSEKDMPNILLQVAAKCDGESNPARIEASVMLPYF